MEHGAPEILIKDALVFLIAAGVVVPILRMLRLPAVAGFILAGIALGPSGFGRFEEAVPALGYLTISEPEAAAPFAELGVLFLLFLLGLELSVEKLWALRRVVFGSGVVQSLFSALVIGTAAYMLGLPAPAAALVGLALALSSTAIVMQLLIDAKRAASPVGRTALGVLLLQDILVAPILIFVGFAGSDVERDLASVLFEALIEGVAALAVIFLAGRFLLARVFQLAAAAGGRDFLMAMTLLTVVGAAVITASAGLSIALGAFLAGLLLGETEFKHQTEVDLEPFKGLLLGLFFMTVGFSLDLGVIAAQWPLVIGGLAALLLVKAAIAWGAVRVFAGGTALSFEAAMLLAPAGEFAFVILAAGTAAGVIEPEPATLIAAIAGLSMLLIPGTWRVGRWVGSRLPEDKVAPALPDDYSELTGHVVIAGFGRVGRAIAHILEIEAAEIVGLDTDAAKVARQRSGGRKVFLGDASRPEILERVGVRGAAMIVITVDDPGKAEMMVRAARRERPEAPILARAQDTEHASRLIAAGASYVVPDAIEAGLQMSAHVLEEFGYGGEAVRDRIAAERATAYRRASSD